MDWFDVVPFFNDEKFVEIARYLAEQRKQGKVILPQPKDILNAYAFTPFNNVKVVIVGQDPYPTKTHPIGLAFAVKTTVKTLPKSLNNIFQELEKDVGITRNNGDLTDWAQQGVLLLNTCLTVEEGKPGSHSNIGWEMLTNQTIRALNEKRENLVFILWGNHAIRKASLIDEDRHHIIISPHPSPLSAHRGFFGSRPFSRTNEFLRSRNITPIKW